MIPLNQVQIQFRNFPVFKNKYNRSILNALNIHNSLQMILWKRILTLGKDNKIHKISMRKNNKIIKINLSKIS